MAWGLAEFDAEQRGKKVGYSEGLSDGISQGISQGIAQGISQGEHQKAIETAKKFLEMGISIEQVAQGTGLSIDEIQKLN